MTGGKCARQYGTALVVGMIMLVLITLMLMTALNLGTTNFRAMSNMQFRSEALAAADKAIEQIIGSAFTDAPTAEEILVDLDNDDVSDYLVEIAQPQCVYAAQAFGADPSSLSLPPSMSVASTWSTVWDIDATVNGADNAGGAAVRVRTGVRVLLSESEKDDVCP